MKKQKLDRMKLVKIIKEIEIFGYLSDVGAKNLADEIADKYEGKKDEN